MLTEYEKFYNEHTVKDPDVYFENFKSNYETRKACIERFGFAVLTVDAIKMLTHHAPFVEVGAGTGYWAYELQKHGVRIVATDPFSVGKNGYKFKKTWTVIEPINGVEAAKKYADHTLMVIWPCYNKSWAYETLKAYTGNKLVYCGEIHGCTADDAFHDLLADEWEEHSNIPIPHWFGIHDCLDVYVRKPCE